MPRLVNHTYTSCDTLIRKVFFLTVSSMQNIRPQIFASISMKNHSYWHWNQRKVILSARNLFWKIEFRIKRKKSMTRIFQSIFGIATWFVRVGVSNNWYSQSTKISTSGHNRVWTNRLFTLFFWSSWPFYLILFLAKKTNRY